MTNESAETQLKNLLTKALDDAWNAGIAKGKIEGRRAGIEEAIEVIGVLNTESPHTVGKCIVELRRVLEAK